MSRLSWQAPIDLLLLAEAFADPKTVSPWALAELDDVIDHLKDTMEVDHIIRTAIAAFYADRLPGCREALSRVVDDGREGGAVGSAMMALSMGAYDDLNAGRWDAAHDAAVEAMSLWEERGYRLYAWSGHYALALIAGKRGDREGCRARCEAMMEWAAPRQMGRLDDWAHHALAEAALGAGDFEESYAHATAISAPGTLTSHNPAGPVVRARPGRRSRAQRAHRRGSSARRRRPGRRPRSPLPAVRPGHRGRRSDGRRRPPLAELFDQALALPGIEEWPFELARVHLAYGERLRRLGHTREARTQLAAARDGFDRLGAAAWSQRASTELAATGATRQVVGDGGEASLTPQEREVAQLAATGLTNREIAARLYVSPRTVSAHLYRTFPKLGISSRAALRDALNAAGCSHLTDAAASRPRHARR